MCVKAETCPLKLCLEGPQSLIVNDSAHFPKRKCFPLHFGLFSPEPKRFFYLPAQWLRAAWGCTQCHTSHKDPGSSSPVPEAPNLMDSSSLQPKVFQGDGSERWTGPEVPHSSPVFMWSLLMPKWLITVLSVEEQEQTNTERLNNKSKVSSLKTSQGKFYQ